MFSAIPPLQATDAHDLWYNSASSHSFQPAPSSPSDDFSNGRPSSRHGPSPPIRTIHSVLRADELAIQNRKLSIRRFGAGWLKPPGVGKTLQAMEDEKQERDDQEAQALREQAFAEAAALEQAGVDPDLAMGSDGAVSERDLDDEIPDADAGGSPRSATDDDDDADEWADEIEVEDALPGEEGDGDYGSPLAAGAAGAGAAGMSEDPMFAAARDLDDDVPEAGSYQHTDTDVEDSSDGEGDGWGVGGGVGRSSVGSAMAAAAQAVGLGSSVFGSSPAPPVASELSGARRSSGRRAQGREN